MSKSKEKKKMSKPSKIILIIISELRFIFIKILLAINIYTFYCIRL